MIKASVIGATGYVGAELMRLLDAHPEAEVVTAVSKNFSGQQMGDVYANFLPADFSLSAKEAAQAAKGSDIVFLCLPHGASMQAAPVCLAQGAKVIDLSGDYRYDDTSIYEEWYGLPHTEGETNAQAVYGLPEYFREEVRAADIVANPGCYTTTSILALAPLLRAGLVSATGVIIDAKSGVSGAGRQEKLAYSFCETADNFRAYNLTRHRHTSEIEEQLTKLSGKETVLQFTPHLLPVKRGILATIYADVSDGVDAQAVYNAYNAAYGNEPFTHILSTGRQPELKYVVGSNHCEIGFEISGRMGKIVIVSCTDNLLKGAAGQAVQNFNLMFGLEETLGLPRVAWYL